MKRIASLIAVFAFVVSALGLTVAAQHGGMGTPMAGEAHGISNGALYMTITNTGDTPDRLVGVTTDVSSSAEIHNNVMDGGVVQMVPQHDGVEIPAGGELVLEPGGYHIMLIDISRSLLAGDEFSATLEFENAGEVEVTVPIIAAQPEDGELASEPVDAGDLSITGIWARQAPKLDRSTTMSPGTPMADCPMGTPGAGMGHDHAHGEGGMHGDCPVASGTSGAGMDHSDGQQQGMSMGAFYLTITNNGSEPDRLVAVTTDVAETVEIHDVVMDGGVMQMMPQLDGVEIPVGGELVLEPGSYHVMLIGLTESLLAGDSFEATLTFEHAGDVTVTVPVFMGEPDAGELSAEPVEAGDLVLDGIWARQAPKLDDAATPAS